MGELISSFNALTSKGTRQSVCILYLYQILCYYSYSNTYNNRCLQLLNQLDRQEWRDVLDFAQSQVSHFQYDILGSLPLEIVVKILELVDDVRTVVLLQRVSYISCLFSMKS